MAGAGVAGAEAGTAGATAAGTSGSLGTFGSIPTQFGWESFLSGGELAGMGAGAPTLGGTVAATGGSMGTSLWDQITNFFTPSPTSAATQGLQYGAQEIDGMAQSIYDQGASAGMPDYLKSLASGFMPQPGSGLDWLKILGSLGSFLGNKSYSKDIQGLMQQQDPFGSQRPFYQDILRQSYTNPNFLQNNPTFQAMLDPAMRQMQAQLAARGLTNSGHGLHELMRTGTETAAKYMLPFQTMTGQFAGSNIDPRTAGLLGMQSADANRTAMGDLGVGLQELWKIFNQGPKIMY